MSLMYSLQIFVKLVPFITAHDSDILSHIEVYLLNPHGFRLFGGCRPGPEQEEKHRFLAFYLRTTAAACAINDASFSRYRPHAWTPGGRWTIFSQVCTPSEAFSTTNRNNKKKNHMHTEDVRLGGLKTRNTAVWVERWHSCASSVYFSPSLPKKTCYIRQLWHSTANSTVGLD